MTDQSPWRIGFPPSLLAYTGVVPQIRPWQIPSTSVLTAQSSSHQPMACSLECKEALIYNNYRLLQNSTNTWKCYMQVAYVCRATCMRREEFAMCRLYKKKNIFLTKIKEETVSIWTKATQEQWNLRPKAKVSVNYGSGVRKLLNDSGQCLQTGLRPADWKKKPVSERTKCLTCRKLYSCSQY
jgi:hypothetical protein